MTKNQIDGTLTRTQINLYWNLILRWFRNLNYPYIWFLTSYHSKKHEKHPGTMAHNTVGLGTQLDTFRWC